MKDEFGLKEGAERGERGECGEIEQHIGSRKTIDARIWRFISFWGGEVYRYTILHKILLWECFFIVLFQPSVHI